MADKRVTGEWERKTNRAGKEKHPTQFHVNIRDFIADVMFAVNALPALVRTVAGDFLLSSFFGIKTGARNMHSVNAYHPPLQNVLPRGTETRPRYHRQRSMNAPFAYSHIPSGLVLIVPQLAHQQQNLLYFAKPFVNFLDPLSGKACPASKYLRRINERKTMVNIGLLACQK